jgi:hypothetical protein
MTNRLHDRMTPGRLAWLQRLAQGPAVRPHSPVGYQCMQLGWTEWVRNPLTQHIGNTERLTDLGRQRLQQATQPSTFEPQ